MAHIARQIVNKYGFAGLFQGWWSAVVCLGASNFVFFYTFNMFKMIYQIKVLESRKKAIDPYTNLVVAAAAGVINVLLTTPLWVVNTRLTVQDNKNPKYSGVYDCLTSIAREEGTEKLWSGVASGLLLVSNPSIHFVVYDKIRPPMMKLAEKYGLGVSFVGFWVGAIAKMVATITTYPVQTAQAKLRNDKKKEYSSTTDCLTKLYEKEGVAAWFRGMEAKLWQTVLTAAFQFMTYEATNKFVTDLLMGQQAAKTVAKAAAH